MVFAFNLKRATVCQLCVRCKLEPGAWRERGAAPSEPPKRGKIWKRLAPSIGGKSAREAGTVERDTRSLPLHPIREHVRLVILRSVRHRGKPRLAEAKLLLAETIEERLSCLWERASRRDVRAARMDGSSSRRDVASPRASLHSLHSNSARAAFAILHATSRSKENTIVGHICHPVSSADSLSPAPTERRSRGDTRNPTA